MLYLTIAFYLTFLAFRYDFGVGKGGHFRVANRWIAFVILVLLSGLRYRLAPDTVAYMTQFQEYVPLSELSWVYLENARYQPLWVLLNSICKTFDSFILLQLIVSCIFNGCVFHFFRKSTKNTFSAILLYYLICYFYFNMDILRESLAIAMFLIAILQYANKRLYYFYLWVILAGLFHIYALCLLALPLILTKKINSTYKIIAILSGLLLISIYNPIVFLASTFNFLEKLDFIIYDISSKLTSIGIAYQILRLLPIVFILLFYRIRAIPNLYIQKNIIFSLCWLYVVIIIIRIIAFPFFDRLSNYFILLVISCIVSALPDLIDRLHLRNFRIPIVGCVMAVSFLFYILPLLGPAPYIASIPVYSRYYPYSSIFTKALDVDREKIIELEGKE